MPHVEKQLRNALRKAKYHYAKGLRYYDKRHNTYNPAGYADNILQHVSDLCEMHGLLAYEPGDNNPSHPKYSYINSGDTYALTLFYNHVAHRFFLSTFGDVVEREERFNPELRDV